ncbi:hypothetical protein OIDMADRAFT_51193 [Oidiodendron maius Zn]|uniref:Heterokaryon incompatibility domain-containing protein n=1 Tax=Oidiodendron maius (strain Zn) TaxID=913774 RepID=A0A0C3HAV1_OIDMZ|nr:hypothetical protein OIDMADRAFT_51193 [Oidiodendron maius Zn]
MEPFKYSGLIGDSSFRVIFLEPGQAHDELRCRLEAHDATSAPEYEALSYVWGGPERKRILVSEGKQLLITTALEVALARLRLPDLPRVLWVDQLCINQDDLDERTQQVQLMKSIYSKAKRVLVWLGIDDENQASGAKEVIKKIDAVWNDRIGSIMFPTNEELEKRGLPPKEASCWRDLEQMMNKPYFERIWVVQECRVASDVLILWGAEQFSWDEYFHTYFWSAVNNAGDYGRGSKSVTLNWPNSQILFSTTNYGDFGLKLDWIGLLEETKTHKSTDSRDKLYALLGLFEENGPSIRPDYHKPASEVFADFTANMIPQMDSLILLSFAQLAKNDQFPLWAPRWVSDISEECSYKPFTFYDFSASRKLRPVSRERSKWDVLELKGLLIDSMELTSSPLLEDISESGTNTIQNAWDLLGLKKQQIENRYMEAHGVLKAFVWTLTAGQGFHSSHPHSKPAENSLFLDFAAYQIGSLQSYMALADEQLLTLTEQKCQRAALQLGLEARDAYQYLEMNPEARSEVSSDDLRDWMKDWMLEAHAGNNNAWDLAWDMFKKIGINPDATDHYHILMVLITMWRKIFVSKQGYVGLSSHNVQPGDQICVLFGGSTPYIVRPTSISGEYLFLGECYVHGLMNGEAIQQWEEGILPSQWFHLR